MKQTKLLIILSCLLVFTLIGANATIARTSRPESSTFLTASATVDALLFKLLVERSSPLFAGRDRASVITTIPAGEQVLALEKYDMGRGDGQVVLRVQYLDKHGKEYSGWVYGTLRITFPH